MRAVVLRCRRCLAALAVPRPGGSGSGLCGLAALALSAGAAALSADQAVRLALSRPDVLQAQQATLDLADSERLRARSWPNPLLRLEREDPDSPTAGASETRIGVAQEFQLGQRRALAREAAELGLEAARLDRSAALQALRIDVLDRYYTLLARERLVRAWREHGMALQRLARIAARRQQAGDLSGYESRRIAQLERLGQARQAELAAEAESARALLAASIGLPDPRPEPGTALAPPPPPSLQALRIRLPQSTHLMALERAEAAAERAARAAGSLMLPVTVGIGQKRFADGGGDALLLDFSVPLPLFDRNQADAARTRALAEQASARRTSAGIEAEAAVLAAWFEVDRLVAAATALRGDAMPQAARISQIASTSFEAGELELIGLIDAYDSEIEAVEHTVNLELRARRAALQLERLTQGETP